ncbi:hypothetical protein PSOLE_09650 [Pseudomonas oleovorans subsp. oleovorans]|uniref:Uncharacterized protein n=1 Tax=Ectopseudomonas oleovorans TaxID=301 RepID=A0A379JNW7_ECTOL|nr:hypothetical protein [Pseudomonas oleovorans]OWK48285.1 hypothetical protein PSOLE_09650 [Pseudomonas oleovorans subsp. oleovorans]SEK02726.1 hypothetical protein SAMN05216280_11072 [Pseudomonas oleovorans]SUD50178.1 Uncharacterised protein [Pseudomonas oleovorans]
MKKILILIAIFTSHPLITHAENYRLDGLYEISIPKDWRIVSSSHATELMNQASTIANKAKVEHYVDLKDIATPFMIYKENGNEVFLTRILIGPPELTKEEFDSLTVSDINTLGNELSKRQSEIMKVSGIKLVSSQSGTGTFKGTPAVRTESLSYNSMGFKVSRAQYIVYRASATLIISLEHTVFSGEPNYKLIENQISSFNVLAQR